MSIDGLIALLTAPFVGSFLGTVIDRMPAGRPVLIGRSACDHCGRHLAAVDLVPILSWLWQRGRCRACGAALRPFYPLIELAATAVAASAALVLSGWLLLASLCLGWSLLVLAVIDTRHKILPDPITLPLVLAGVGVTAAHAPWQLQDHVIGAIVGFSSLAAIAWVYRRSRGRDGLGLGDAKLFAAAGAWLGWAALPGLLIAAALSALTVALAALVIGRPSGGEPGATGEIAFGPYLALAFWASWLLGPLVVFP